ncbi:MAG: hypothetical protein HC923_05075 [Myxococcales bacterium]|nr:hypothetical protein [Myxococcales bacterium]
MGGLRRVCRRGVATARREPQASHQPSPQALTADHADEPPRARGRARTGAVAVVAPAAQPARANAEKRLSSEGSTRNEIAAALERAEALLLLPSEDELAQGYAAELRGRRGATPSFVFAKLLARGFESHIAHKVVSDTFREWNPEEAANQLIESEQDPLRAARRLKRRGFSADVVRRVLRGRTGVDGCEDG